MASCCDPNGLTGMFDEKHARSKARRYRRDGLDAEARRIVEFLDERIAGRPSTTMPAIPPDVANPCAWGRNPTATGTHRITPIDSFAIRRDGTGRAIKGAPFVPRWEGIWPESLILGGGLIHEYSVAA